MNKKVLFFLIFLFVFSAILNILNGQDKNKKGRVYYLKTIQDFGIVSSAYSAYIKRNLDIANKDPKTKAVIIEIDTPCGGFGDAQKITKYIKNSKSMTISLINDSASSSGAIISLSADYTVIAEGGKIGDAYPLLLDKVGQSISIKDSKVHAKIISFLTGMMRSLAEKRKKRLLREIGKGVQRYSHLKGSKSVQHLEKIFSALVDPEIELTTKKEGYDLKSGLVLTLTSEEAVRLGVADKILNNLKEVLAEFELSDCEIRVKKN